jgi:hypothetical protein
MKKLIAIFFLLTLLINTAGYQLAITMLQTEADRQLEIRIDNDEYSEDQLVEIRVTLDMPYQNRQTGFERHYGEITIEGKAYTYVKRKIEGDVLVLKCIANNIKQELKKKAHLIAQSNSGQDRDNNGKKQGNTVLKILSGDYDDKNTSFQIVIIDTLSVNSYKIYSCMLSKGEGCTPFQPPRNILFS